MKQALKKLNKRTTKEDGAIIIELAMILPFLVVLFVIIVDLGLLVREYQIIQNAAREGARYSSLPQYCISCRPTSCVGNVDPNCQTQAQITTAIKNRVIDYLSQEGITISDSDVTVNQGLSITIGGVVSTASEIVVTHNRAFLVDGAFFLQGSSVPLRGRAVFSNLY